MIFFFSEINDSYNFVFSRNAIGIIFLDGSSVPIFLRNAFAKWKIATSVFFPYIKYKER